MDHFVAIPFRTRIFRRAGQMASEGFLFTAPTERHLFGHKEGVQWREGFVLLQCQRITLERIDTSGT